MPPALQPFAYPEPWLGRTGGRSQGDVLRQSGPAKIQVAVIPFDEMVAVNAGTITASTSISADVKFTTPANGEAGQVADAPKDKTEAGAVAKGTWTGCIVDRPAPFDANGTQPRLPNAATLYPREECHSHSKLKPVRALSTNFADLRSYINSLQPSLLTNNTIGLQWGLEAFSPSAPLTGANVGSRRIMILMTDGKNTNSRDSPSTKTIDLRMQAACNAVKMEEIELFTINLMEGDREQLRICATDSDHFYHVDEASGLTPVFNETMKRVSAVRLTK